MREHIFVAQAVFETKHLQNTAGRRVTMVTEIAALPTEFLGKHFIKLTGPA